MRTHTPANPDTSLLRILAVSEPNTDQTNGPNKQAPLAKSIPNCTIIPFSLSNVRILTIFSHSSIELLRIKTSSQILPPRAPYLVVYMESFTVLTCSWSTHGQMQIGKPRSTLLSNPSPHLSCHRYQLLSTVSHFSQGILLIFCFWHVLHCSIWPLPHTYIHQNCLNSHFQFASQSQDSRYYKKNQTFSLNGYTIYHPSLWDEVKIISCW